MKEMEEEAVLGMEERSGMQKKVQVAKKELSEAKKDLGRARNDMSAALEAQATAFQEQLQEAQQQLQEALASSKAGEELKVQCKAANEQLRIQEVLIRTLQQDEEAAATAVAELQDQIESLQAAHACQSAPANPSPSG